MFVSNIFKWSSLVILLFIFNHQTNFAQDYYGKSQKWLQIAEGVKPELQETIIDPVAVVDIIESKTGFQGCEVVEIAGIFYKEISGNFSG